MQVTRLQVAFCPCFHRAELKGFGVPFFMLAILTTIIHRLVFVLYCVCSHHVRSVVIVVFLALFEDYVHCARIYQTQWEIVVSRYIFRIHESEDLEIACIGYCSWIYPSQG